VAAWLDGKTNHHDLHQQPQADRGSDMPVRHRSKQVVVASHASVEEPAEASKAKQRAERAAETPGRKEIPAVGVVGARGGATDPPELSPVKPLSPFGNFT
jgi:hypothetical protein